MQDNNASSHSLSRRLTKHSTGSLDSKSNKSSFITTHNDVGEQLWIRTIEGSGRAQVMPLPPNGTAPIKLPVNHSMLDVSQKEMVRGRSGKFVAIRIGGAEVCPLHCPHNVDVHIHILYRNMIAIFECLHYT